MTNIETDADQMRTIGALLAAHKTMRDGYADAVAGMRYIEQQHGRLPGVGWDRVYDHFERWVIICEREGLLAGSDVPRLSPATPA